VLRSFGTDELANLLKVSWVELEEGPRAAAFRKSGFLKCERSRLRRPDVEVVSWNGAEVPLTARDRRVLGI
jgi:isoleucyl-tRNA synthetase